MPTAGDGDLCKQSELITKGLILYQVAVSAKGIGSKKKIPDRLAAKYSAIFGTICDRRSCSLWDWLMASKRSFKGQVIDQAVRSVPDRGLEALKYSTYIIFNLKNNLT